MKYNIIRVRNKFADINKKYDHYVTYPVVDSVTKNVS